MLIRVAKQGGNEVDGRTLLTWAEEPFSGSGTFSPGPRTTVNFPVAIFIRQYKGKEYEVLLLWGWRVERDGNEYRSPSAAAAAIAGHPVNGWLFWRYEDDGGRTADR